jgi:hypothetical protein
MTPGGHCKIAVVDMKNAQEIPWKRICVEAAAIVASILLVVAIDAWWGERLERSNEQVLLTRLGAEFSSNLERMAQVNYSFVVDASLKLFRLIDEAMLNEESTVEVPAGMLRLALIAGLFEADMPMLDALTKAGKLDVVDESRIVAAVSVWERQLRDYTSMTERERRNVDTLLLPALYKRGDIGPLQVGPFITSTNAADPMWRVPVVINIDSEIKGLVAGRYARALDAQRDFEELRMAAVEVFEAIEGNTTNP